MSGDLLAALATAMAHAGITDGYPRLRWEERLADGPGGYRFRFVFRDANLAVVAEVKVNNAGQVV